MIRNILHKFGLANAAKFERIVMQDRAESPDAFHNADAILRALHAGVGLNWPKAALQPDKLVDLRRRLNELKPDSVLELEGVQYKGAACTNVFSLPTVGTILVDMRLPTVKAMHQRLQRFAGTTSDPLINNIRERFQYLSEFHRA